MPWKCVGGPGYGLDESGMDAVARDWRLEPAMKAGKPVDARITVESSGDTAYGCGVPKNLFQRRDSTVK